MDLAQFRTPVGYLVAGSFLVAVATAMNNPKPVVPGIDPAEAFGLMQTEKVLVLDVRSKGAYERGHLPKAVSVPLEALDARLPEIAAAQAARVVVYCNDGSNRGPLATEKLNKAGYPQAANLNRGIEGWRAARLPVEK
jgi:rhodanese-related sulfurtransferase